MKNIDYIIYILEKIVNILKRDKPKIPNEVEHFATLDQIILKMDRGDSLTIHLNDKRHVCVIACHPFFSERIIEESHKVMEDVEYDSLPN